MFPGKLQTTLTYRFPGESIVEKHGVFKKLDNPGEFKGFIISGFEGTEFYGFFEGEAGEQLSAVESPVVIGKSEYCDLAHEFIRHLKDHDIGKAIFSRIKHVAFDERGRLDLFRKLSEKYPGAFCYTFDSPMLGKWIGATPETLVRIEQGRGETMSLAGTKPVGDFTAWGEKEVYEQQLVTDFIYSELLAVCKTVSVSERAELIAGPVKHLVHHFEFTVEADKEWQLTRSVHPTPAVSGFPRAEALRCISHFEPHNRSLYAGIIGEVTTVQSRLFVNLRSAQIISDGLYLYVGGGLTQESIPESEWQETENKATTILDLVHSQCDRY